MTSFFDANDILRERGQNGGREWFDAAHAAGQGRAKGHTNGTGRPTSDDEPLPLVRPLPPAEPFPIESLGDVMATAVRGFHAATQAPLDICANAAIAVAALAGQAHADVVLPTGEVKPLSLFLITVARSGERKTSVDSRALAPAKDRQAELRKSYEAEIEAYLNNRAVWEAQRKKALASKKLDFNAQKAELDRLGPEPTRPLTPVLLCHEPTIEGLAKLLVDGQPSIGVFASEGGAFIGGHGFTEEAKLRTAACLSMLWDNGELTRVRAGDSVTALVGRRISMHLQAQPDVAARLLSDRTLCDQGLLSRILVAAPDTRQGQRFWREVGSEHNLAMEAYCARIQALFQRPMPLKEGASNELSPRSLKLTSEARDMWITFSDEVEYGLSRVGNLQTISGFAAKLPEHALRLAGILTLFENPDACVIGAATLANGIALSKHYAKTALRLHGVSQMNAELLEAEALLSWLHIKWVGEYGAVVSLPEIVKYGPNSVRDTRTARRLIDILEGHRHLKRLKEPAEVMGKMRRDVWKIEGLDFA